MVAEREVELMRKWEAVLAECMAEVQVAVFLAPEMAEAEMSSEVVGMEEAAAEETVAGKPEAAGESSAPVGEAVAAGELADESEAQDDEDEDDDEDKASITPKRVPTIGSSSPL
ncbi:hypothetical protein C0992_002547 [Termitomyces sp. T32_za158]|nr:hypothetical protein C0992_002547 [Termitomyces sp. T32_za158]